MNTPTAACHSRVAVLASVAGQRLMYSMLEQPCRLATGPRSQSRLLFASSHSSKCYGYLPSRRCPARLCCSYGPACLNAFLVSRVILMPQPFVVCHDALSEPPFMARFDKATSRMTTSQSRCSALFAPMGSIYFPASSRTRERFVY